MKKTFLFLAGSAIMFASCGEKKTEESKPSQAQIDSTVNAQVAEKEAAMKAENDAKIAAAAKAQADSIEAAKTATETKTKTTTKTTTHTTKPTAPAPPPPPPAPTTPKPNPRPGAH